MVNKNTFPSSPKIVGLKGHFAINLTILNKSFRIIPLKKMHFIPFLIFITFLPNISIQSKHNNKAKAQQKKMHKQLPKLIEAPALYEAIKVQFFVGFLNEFFPQFFQSTREHLRILDCTFLPKPRPYKEFQQNFYGKFEEQVKRGEPNFKAWAANFDFFKNFSGHMTNSWRAIFQPQRILILVWPPTRRSLRNSHTIRRM